MTSQSTRVSYPQAYKAPQEEWVYDGYINFAFRSAVAESTTTTGASSEEEGIVQW